MYCDHPSCKKEVDINSVAVSQSTNAVTMFNDDGLGMTRVGGGNDKIVNVCKSCGESEYLFADKESAKIILEQRAEERKRLQKEANEFDPIFMLKIIGVAVALIFLLILFLKWEESL